MALILTSNLRSGRPGSRERPEAGVLSRWRASTEGSAGARADRSAPRGKHRAQRVSLPETVAESALHHPFYSPRASLTPSYQSQADVMLLIASRENWPEEGGGGPRAGLRVGGDLGLVMQVREGAVTERPARLARPGHTHTPALSLHIRPGVARAHRQPCVFVAACSRHEPMVPKPAA